MNLSPPLCTFFCIHLHITLLFNFSFLVIHIDTGCIFGEDSYNEGESVPHLCYHLICTSGIWVYTGVNNICKYLGPLKLYICRRWPLTVLLIDKPIGSATMNGNGGRSTILTQQVMWTIGPTGKATATAQDGRGGYSSHLRIQCEACWVKLKGTPQEGTEPSRQPAVLLYKGATSAGMSEVVSTWSDNSRLNFRMIVWIGVRNIHSL